MIFKVDLASAKPVYQQMVDQVKFAIASGRLQPGDRLPPIRDVAVQIRVNRNTVARVYSELERDGILYTRAGQGAFVGDQKSQVSRAEQKRQLQAGLDELIAQAKLFGFTREQFIALTSERLQSIYPAEKQEAKPITQAGGKR